MIDPLTASIVVILGKYALDKGVELGKEVGPKALETGKEIFQLVLGRVKKVDPRTAQKYSDNPEGYKVPLNDVLAELLQQEPDFAAKLKALVDQYEAEAKEYAAAAGVSYQANQTGDGLLVQGEGAVGVQQGDHG
jgi:hypothetical protein